MKKHLYTKLLIVASLIFTLQATAQKEKAEDRIFEARYVDSLPSYPGGEQEFKTYIANNFQPPKNYVNGEVVVDFVVEADGRITNVKIVKRLNPETDNEARRLMRASKPWIPAKIRTINVRCRMQLPIKVSSFTQ